MGACCRILAVLNRKMFYMYVFSHVIGYLSADGVGKAGMYADGKPHQLLYKRSKSEMILTVCGLILGKC